MIDTPAAMALARAYYEVFQLIPGGTPFSELNGGKVEQLLALSKKIEFVAPLSKDYIAEFKAIEKADLAKEEELDIDRHINAHYDGPYANTRPAPTREQARKAILEAKAKVKKEK